MSLTVTTPADDISLTTLAAVKGELGITDETSDEELQRYIEAASNFIRRYTERTFGRERVTELLPGRTDNPIMLLERTPVITVHQVKFNGSTISSTGFVIDNANAGTLFRENGWQDTRMWTQHIVAHVTRHKRRLWEFDYTAGYILPCQTSTAGESNLPMEIQQAAITIVKQWQLSAPENPNVRSQRTGDASETLFEQNVGGITGIAPGALNLLKSWRRIEVNP